LNYAVPFIREDGRQTADTPLTTMIRHLDYLVDKLGEDGVALGSDFDGALVPAEIGDVSGVPALVGAMRQAGYGEQLVDKICQRNWKSVLRRTIG
jgi:membrane dipeptidase